MPAQTNLTDVAYQVVTVFEAGFIILLLAGVTRTSA